MAPLPCAAAVSHWGNDDDVTERQARRTEQGRGHRRSVARRCHLPLPSGLTPAIILGLGVFFVLGFSGLGSQEISGARHHHQAPINN